MNKNSRKQAIVIVLQVLVIMAAIGRLLLVLMDNMGTGLMLSKLDVQVMRTVAGDLQRTFLASLICGVILGAVVPMLARNIRAGI